MAASGCEYHCTRNRIANPIFRPARVGFRTLLCGKWRRSMWGPNQDGNRVLFLDRITRLLPARVNAQCRCGKGRWTASWRPPRTHCFVPGQHKIDSSSCAGNSTPVASWTRLHQRIRDARSCNFRWADRPCCLSVTRNPATNDPTGRFPSVNDSPALADSDR
jgi:hypothetical protein